MKHLYATFSAILMAVITQLPCSAMERETREVSGWTVRIDSRLLAKDEAKSTEHAVGLLKKQLDEIVRVVPPDAVTELRKVPLYFTTPYANAEARAEFHPSEDWLTENDREAEMAGAIEFTNTRTLESDIERSPYLVLHVLAHAYHNLTVPDGVDNQDVYDAYNKASGSGKYDKVEHYEGKGQKKQDVQAQAMTDEMEYFAENSEAYFGRNDFYPFTRGDLKKVDPECCTLLEKLWGVKPAAP